MISWLFYFFWGYGGIYVFKIITLLVLFLAVGGLLKDLKFPSLNLLWFFPLFSYILIDSLDFKSENYSVVFFVIILRLLNRIDFGIGMEKRKKYYFYFVIIFALWANVHSGFVYGLFLISVFFIGGLINRVISFEKRKWFNLNDIYLQLFIVSFFATLINPFGLKIYLVFLENLVSVKIFEKYIYEWMPVDIKRENYITYIISVGVNLIAYIYWNFKNKRLNFTEIILIAYFVISGFLHQRITIYTFIIVSFLGIKYFLGFASSALKNILAILLVSFILFKGFNQFEKNIKVLIENGFYVNQWVSDASINFIVKNKEYLGSLKLYNGWNTGGSLAFGLYGYNKTFMDGRYIFSNMLEEYIETTKNSNNFEKYDRKYNFGLLYFHIPPSVKKEMYKVINNEREYFVARPYFIKNINFDKWGLIYFDRKNMVFVKKTLVDKEFLKRNEYKFLKPYDFEYIYLIAEKDTRSFKKIKDEMLRYIKDNGVGKDNFSEIFIYILLDLRK
ncbi:MAG: hypothetical protein K6357_08420 [Elusimicrobiota bacterium]